MDACRVLYKTIDEPYAQYIACGDLIESPFGSLTSIELTAICLFTHSASNTRKLLVASGSKIAVGDVFSEGVELR
jgi:hypothetical protein